MTKGRLCKLKKALYALKQSPIAWFERLHKVMSWDINKVMQTYNDHQA